VAAQAAELWALWPFRPEKPPPAAGRSGLAVAAMFLLAAVFGAVSVPLWLLPGALGPAGAVLLLAGAILSVLTVSRGSPLAFIAGAIPYAAYLLSAPLIDRSQRGPDPFSGPFLIAELLFLIIALLVFRAAERLSESVSRRFAELDARRAAAEANAQARSAFAAMVSHELRTPLSAILAAAGDIQRRAGEPEVFERAGLVVQAGRSMRILLDDLLDLCKLEAGRMNVEEIAFDPKLLIEDMALFWSAEAERKGLVLTVVGAECLPEEALGDPLRLRQILNNLLSNAVKFTDVGGVRIEAAAHEAAGGRLALKVSVVDSGRGISPDRLASVFQPFEQGDASVARTHGGTGLGLAISGELARLMGGDLTVESTLGEGSRFTLLATLGHAPAGFAMAEPGLEPAIAEGPPTAARILIVDDHEIGRRAMSLLLAPLHAEVAEATGGAEALARLSAEPFDLVLMDVTMEGMDGLEACRRLRGQDGPNRSVPVVAVTGRTEPAEVEACRAAGMTGWVAKPVEARALFQAIERALMERPRSDIAAA
jgi:signal transduction histidine kinase/ActR/RegA family two-component response regulator